MSRLGSKLSAVWGSRVRSVFGVEVAATSSFARVCCAEGKGTRRNLSPETKDPLKGSGGPQQAPNRTSTPTVLAACLS